MSKKENDLIFEGYKKTLIREEGEYMDASDMESQPGMGARHEYHVREGESVVDVIVYAVSDQEMYQISVPYEGEDPLGAPTLKLPQALVDRVEKAQNEFMEAQSILERAAREQGVELPYGE